MSIFSKLLKLLPCKGSNVSVIKNIDATRESLLRLELLAEEITKKERMSRAHEKLLEIATDDIDSPMWGKDLESRFVFMNVACIEKILKTTSDDVLNLTDEDFEHDALAQVCMQSDVLVQDTMQTHRQIEHARYDDGTDLWIDTTKSPWIVDGEIIGTVGFGKDITKYVPEYIKEKYKKPGWFTIGVDVMYNASDISELVGE